MCVNLIPKWRNLDAKLQIFKKLYIAISFTLHLELTRLSWHPKQRPWKDEYRGRCTERLIPDIKSWLGRKFGEVNYYVIQMPSVHGYFKKYLHRMGKTASPYCLYKEEKVIDVAEPTVFEYTRWKRDRSY